MLMRTPRNITGARETPETKANTVPVNSIKIRNCSPRLLILALVIIGALTSCGGAKNASKDFDADSDEDPALDAKVKKGVKPQADADVAVIETADFGTIVIELY